MELAEVRFGEHYSSTLHRAIENDGHLKDQLRAVRSLRLALSALPRLSCAEPRR